VAEGIKTTVQDKASDAKDWAQDTGEDIIEEARDKGQAALDQARRVKGQAVDKVHDLKENVKDKAHDIYEQAQDKTQEITEQAQNKTQKLGDKAQKKLGKAKDKVTPEQSAKDLDATEDRYHKAEKWSNKQIRASKSKGHNLKEHTMIPEEQDKLHEVRHRASEYIDSAKDWIKEKGHQVAEQLSPDQDTAQHDKAKEWTKEKAHQVKDNLTPDGDQDKDQDTSHGLYGDATEAWHQGAGYAEAAIKPGQRIITAATDIAEQLEQNKRDKEMIRKQEVSGPTYSTYQEHIEALARAKIHGQEQLREFLEVIRDELILLMKKCHEIKERRLTQKEADQIGDQDHDAAIARCQSGIDKLKRMESEANEALEQIARNQGKAMSGHLGR